MESLLQPYSSRVVFLPCSESWNRCVLVKHNNCYCYLGSSGEDLNTFLPGHTYRFRVEVTKHFRDSSNVTGPVVEHSVRSLEKGKK